MFKINPVTIRSLLVPDTMPAMPALTNLWAIEDDAVIGLDLSFSYLYELVLPDLTLKSEPEIADFLQGVRRFLDTIPAGVIIQFLTRYLHGNEEAVQKYRDTIRTSDDIGKLVVEAKVEHLGSIFIQNRKTYLFVTMPAPGAEDLKKMDSRFFRINLKDHKPAAAAVHSQALKDLNNASSLLMSQLRQLGIDARKLNREQSMLFLYRYLNPGRAQVVKEIEYNSERTLRSQLFFNACENAFDYTYLDGFYYRAINFYVRPEEVSILMLLNFMGQLIPDLDLSITVVTADQDAMMHKLHITDSVARNIDNMSGFKKNHEAIQQSQDARQMMADVKTSFQKIYFYKFAVIVKDRQLENLTARTNRALQLLRLIGEAGGVIDDMNHLNLFLAGLPGNSHLNPRQEIFHSEAVANLLPLSAEWQGTKESKLLLLTDNNEIIPFDLFDESLSAKHGLIIGQTGGGKSFATNYLLKDFFIESEKNHIIIIDVGGSYRKLCSLFGGQYLEVELSERFAFNPFPSKKYSIINPDPATFEVDNDVIAYITGLTQKMLHKPVLAGKEQKIIETAVVNTYKNCQSEQPLLGDFHRELENFASKDEDLRTIAYEYARNLEIWTTGRYGKILNRENALTIDNRLVVFDLQKLDSEKELQSVIFFIISSVIETKLKDKTLRKMIVIDEGWKFFNDDVGSLLIENLYRTARKFNAAIYSISQSPVDFLGTKAANSIISNTYLKFVLKIKSGFELLEKFGLNPQEIEKVRNLRIEKGLFSEVFLKFNEHSRVVKIQSSPVDYYICTTDPDDSQKEAAVRAAHPDYTTAQVIQTLAENRKEAL